VRLFIIKPKNSEKKQGQKFKQKTKKKQIFKDKKSARANELAVMTKWKTGEKSKEKKLSIVKTFYYHRVVQGSYYH